MTTKNEEKKHYIRSFFIIILLIIGTIIFYSHFIETKGLTIREYGVKNAKLPDSYHGFKIIHFSDLHFGTTVNLNNLPKIIEKINSLNPDIIFFTGDLIDKNYAIKKDELSDMIKLLNSLDSLLGTYFIKGNHDFNEYYSEVIEKTSIKLLENSSELISYNGLIPILIIGLDDELMGNLDIPKAFENYDETIYTILLVHEPDSYNKLGDYKPDLILSGHSHNGQVRLPFIGSVIKVPGAKMYYDEKYIIGNSEMYISGGIGTSNYPFRLLTPPSINFYRMYNK